ncbi:Nudix family hydrolase [Candidatus Thiothrix sp. Deng01]|uniref:8-oxo-dGTP diphosphatase n=1 Tax=Candidatus Thiothrix phosphatis TaxID=3112415 RepID=A0ABU6CZT6_9GAMM|nr:Nudix family hydrolase [Candidatus Thiothrix sp. Deng01]MEB4592086.1 Nudix family hydrolase [Candidatus Thiothrix sp. Deng01]
MPNTVPDAGYLHVVAAVIRDEVGNILLAQRPANKHQGGKWEFPGGKLEVGEAPAQALNRELEEELGITVLQAKPLIKVRHVYPERAVLLDVWEVTAFSGDPHGREGQPVAWLEPEQLPMLEFPPANYPIITAARLPAHCLITPEPVEGHAAFLQQLERALRSGVRLVQFRAKTLSADSYLALAQDAVSLAQSFTAKIMLNSPPVMLKEANGLHLTSRQLWQMPAFLRQNGQWLSASCHNGQELRRAAEVGVDFALLSPVLPTLSHPEAAGLGWDAFAEAVEGVNFPVYALGGMARRDALMARRYGGQGIAAIRSLWFEEGQ